MKTTNRNTNTTNDRNATRLAFSAWGCEIRPGDLVKPVGEDDSHTMRVLAVGNDLPRCVLLEDPYDVIGDGIWYEAGELEHAKRYPDVENYSISTDADDFYSWDDYVRHRVATTTRKTATVSWDYSREFPDSIDLEAIDPTTGRGEVRTYVPLEVAVAQTTPQTINKADARSLADAIDKLISSGEVWGVINFGTNPARD